MSDATQSKTRAKEPSRQAVLRENWALKTADPTDDALFPPPDTCSSLTPTVVTPYMEFSYSRDSHLAATFAEQRRPIPLTVFYPVKDVPSRDSWKVGDFCAVLRHGAEAPEKMHITDFTKHAIVLDGGILEIRTVHHPEYRGEAEPTLLLPKETPEETEARIKKGWRLYKDNLFAMPKWRSSPRKESGCRTSLYFDEVDPAKIIVARNPTLTKVIYEQARLTQEINPTVNELQQRAILGTIKEEFTVKDKDDKDLWSLMAPEDEVYRYLDDLPTPRWMMKKRYRDETQIGPEIIAHRFARNNMLDERIRAKEVEVDNVPLTEEKTLEKVLYPFQIESLKKDDLIKEGSKCANLLTYEELVKKEQASKDHFLCPFCRPIVTYLDGNEMYTLAIDEKAKIPWEKEFPKSGKKKPKTVSFPEDLRHSSLSEYSVASLMEVFEQGLNLTFIEHNKSASHVPLFLGYDRPNRSKIQCMTAGQVVHTKSVYSTLARFSVSRHAVEVCINSKTLNPTILQSEMQRIWTNAESDLSRMLALKPDKSYWQNDRHGMEYAQTKTLFLNAPGVAEKFARCTMNYWKDVDERLARCVEFRNLDCAAEENTMTVEYAYNAINLWLLEGHCFGEDFIVFGDGELDDQHTNVKELAKELAGERQSDNISPKSETGLFASSSDGSDSNSHDSRREL